MQTRIYLIPFEMIRGIEKDKNKFESISVECITDNFLLYGADFINDNTILLNYYHKDDILSILNGYIGKYENILIHYCDFVKNTLMENCIFFNIILPTNIFLKKILSEDKSDLSKYKNRNALRNSTDEKVYPIVNLTNKLNIIEELGYHKFYVSDYDIIGFINKISLSCNLNSEVEDYVIEMNERHYDFNKEFFDIFSKLANEIK